MSEGAMLRTPQAAEFLGVSPATLCKWRVFGGGPRYKKLGRVVVYDPADLREWLDTRSRRSTSNDLVQNASVDSRQAQEGRRRE